MMTKHIVTINNTIINGLSWGEGDVYYTNEQGQFHRDDGPAMIGVNFGLKIWYKNGKKHRVDGPAIEYRDGSEEWFFNNQRHRDGGPAVSYNNGLRQWFQYGKLHRLDGPAEYGFHHRTFYIDDVKVEDASPSIWLLIKANPENIIYFGYTSKEMQEYVIQRRPDLINKIQDLKVELKERYVHELSLSKIDI